MTHVIFGRAGLGALALALAACGGGGSDSKGCSSIDPDRNSNLPGCPAAPTTAATVALSLLGADGAAATSVAPDHNATLRAVIRNASGTVLPNVLLTVTSSDKTATFTPDSASALSDANGVATIVLKAGSQSGAFLLTASATVNGTVITSTLNYSTVFPTLTLGALNVAPATLSAGGTAGLSVAVMNGTALYAPVQSVAFSSPRAPAAKRISI